MEFCKVLHCKSNQLLALLEAPNSILFPHTITVVPIPQLCSTVGPPVGYSALLGLASFLHPFSLRQSPPLTSIYTVFCLSPSLSFIIFQFLLLFLLFSFVYFLLLHIGSSLPFCTTQTLLLPSLFTLV